MKKRIMSKPKSTTPEENESLESLVAEETTPNLLHPDDQIYTKSNEATNLLIKAIESLSSSSTSPDESMDQSSLLLFQSIPSHFLTMKQTNRRLTNECYLNLQSQIKTKRQDLESQSIQLQNLIYEKTHLERQIKDCQEGFENDLLLKVAKEELGLVHDDDHDDRTDDTDQGDASTNANDNANANTNTAEEKGSSSTKTKSSTSEVTEGSQKIHEDDDNEKEDGDDDDDQNETKTRQTNETIINNFFSKSFSYVAPSRHQYNMSKLMNAITERGKLNNQVAHAKKRKNQLVVDLKNEEEFLKSIPGQIGRLEEWSMPIQDYFKKQRVGGGGGTTLDYGKSGDDSLGVELLIGSERNERLRHARELSGPMYNLFVQFQSFLDVHCTKRKAIQKDDNNESDEYDSFDDVEMDAVKSQDETISDIHEWKLFVIDCENENDTATSVEAEVKQYIQSESKAIQLWIPIPNVSVTSSSSSSKKIEYVKIQFEYLPKLQVITVKDGLNNASTSKNTRSGTSKVSSALEKLSWSNMRSSCSTRSGHTSSLLYNLFQNDFGFKLPDGCGANLCFDSSEDSDTVTDENKVNEEDKDNLNNKEETSEMIDGEGGIDMLVDYDDEEEDSNETHFKMEKPNKGEILLQQIISSLQEQANEPKCYNWCQYLAGLHYSQSAELSDESSKSHYRIYPTTKTTMMRLSRRIRSHATLTAIIKMLQGSNVPNPVPVHPSMEDVLSSNTSISAKVDKWSEDPGSDCYEKEGVMYKEYSVILKRKSKTLNMSVKIHPQYPAVPPKWSLQPTSSGSNPRSLNNTEDSHLFDTVLSTIESDVNTLSNRSRFFNDIVEESYDWVLLHQLHFIISSWDCYERKGSSSC